MTPNIRLPIKEVQRFLNISVQKAVPVVKYVNEHKPAVVWGTITSGAVVDSIRIRIKWNKDNKRNVEIQSMQKKAIQKHEAEINVLKRDAEMVPELERTNDMLAQSLKDIAGGECSDE